MNLESYSRRGELKESINPLWHIVILFLWLILWIFILIIIVADVLADMFDSIFFRKTKRIKRADFYKEKIKELKQRDVKINN